MTKRQRLYAWLLIILSYVVSYGTTFAAAYHYLAKDTISGYSAGGAMFLTVVGITSLTLIISIRKMINKMKANFFKTMFKSMTHLGIVYLIKLFVLYVNINTASLDIVLNFAIAGMVLGTLIEAIAVHKYKDYIREVGVL